MEPATERALQVRVFDDRDGSVGLSKPGLVLADSETDAVWFRRFARGRLGFRLPLEQRADLAQLLEDGVALFAGDGL